MILALAQVGDTALSLQPLQPSTIFFSIFEALRPTSSVKLIMASAPVRLDNAHVFCYFVRGCR